MIGEVLKKTRFIYGISAIEMSYKLGISASYLSEIENGKKQPSLELLQKYADIYNIKLSSLILLSENYESIRLTDGEAGLIRKMMLSLINKSYERVEDEDRTEKV